MNEKEFYTIADATLTHILDVLERLDEAGELEVDADGGIVTITLLKGAQYVLSKHAPSRQLWLSSPVSGGLHFSFDAKAQAWALPDGRQLGSLLSEELRATAAIEVEF